MCLLGHNGGAVPQLFRIPTPHPGRLAVVERPRGGEWLRDDMAALRRAGVDTLVSALVDEELRHTWLEFEAAAAEEAGIRFLRLPVANLGTPPLPGALGALHGLATEVEAGRFVAAHCFASVGRSPLIVASVMVLLGADPAFAWEELELCRGRQVPDTLEQREWVYQLRRVAAEALAV
jgi:protein-tyrosine phosphatase